MRIDRPIASACGVAEHALRRRVPGGDDAVEVLGDDRVVRRFDHRGEPPAAASAALALADVARDLRRADDAARRRRKSGETVSEIGISVPSFRWRIVSKCATAWPARMRARTSSSSPWRSAGMIIRIERPDRLGGGVAEHPLRGPVPRRDDAVQILADDGVVGRFDNFGEVSKGEIEGRFRHEIDGADGLNLSSLPGRAGEWERSCSFAAQDRPKAKARPLESRHARCCVPRRF